MVDHVNRSLTTPKKIAIDKSIEVNLVDIAIAVDRDGVCHLNLEDGVSLSKSWECTVLCKEFTDEQKKIVLQLKSSFGD